MSFILLQKIKNVIKFQLNRYSLINNLKKKNFKPKKKIIIFFGHRSKSYFGGNLKYWYLNFIKSKLFLDYKIYYLCFDIRIKKLLHKQNLPHLYYNKQNYLKILDILSETMYLIFDRDISKADIKNELYYAIKNSIKIQLWHGRQARSHPFKNDKVTNNILNKKYKFLKLRKEHRGNDIDYFLGDFKHEKKNLINHYFNPKKFITAPRAQYSNIKKLHTKSELINVDKIILNKIKNRKRANLRNILYVPTNSHGEFKMLNFKYWDNQLKQTGDKLFIKFHIDEKKIVLRNLKNIHVISQNSDVVPLLWHFDLLITDNSSINYDFLKTKKQTIFFRPFEYNVRSNNRVNYYYKGIYKKILYNKKSIARNEKELFIKINSKKNSNTIKNINKKYDMILNINSKKEKNLSKIFFEKVIAS